MRLMFSLLPLLNVCSLKTIELILENTYPNIVICDLKNHEFLITGMHSASEATNSKVCF